MVAGAEDALLLSEPGALMPRTRIGWATVESFTTCVEPLCRRPATVSLAARTSGESFARTVVVDRSAAVWLVAVDRTFSVAAWAEAIEAQAARARMVFLMLMISSNSIGRQAAERLRRGLASRAVLLGAERGEESFHGSELHFRVDRS
jgi:hypothetical protein